MPGEFGGEHQEPCDSVGPLKRPVCDVFEVSQFTRHVARGEMLIDDAANG